MDKKEIGERIAFARKGKGLTQKELAERLCVTDKTVSKWETGVNFPDITIMENLAGELGISTIELLGLQETKAEDMFREVALISQEEKEKIKKEIRSRTIVTIVYSILLIAAEIYLSYRLDQIGLQGGVYGALTAGLSGMQGTILSFAIYSLINTKKL